jgi:hypothetical protein
LSGHQRLDLEGHEDVYQSCPGETLLFQRLDRRQETVHLTLEDHVTPGVALLHRSQLLTSKLRGALDDIPGIKPLAFISNGGGKVHLEVLLFQPIQSCILAEPTYYLSPQPGDTRTLKRYCHSPQCGLIPMNASHSVIKHTMWRMVLG